MFKKIDLSLLTFIKFALIVALALPLFYNLGCGTETILYPVGGPGQELCRTDLDCGVGYWCTIPPGVDPSWGVQANPGLCNPCRDEDDGCERDAECCSYVCDSGACVDD